RQVEVGMIEDVECLGAKFQRGSLVPHAKVTLQRKIEVKQSRGENYVSRGIAVREWGREAKRRGAEPPVCRSSGAEIGIANHIRALRGRIAVVGLINGAKVDRKWRSALRCQNRRYLPAGPQVLQPAFSASKRKLVHDAGIELMTVVVAGERLLGCQVIDVLRDVGFIGCSAGVGGDVH